MNWRYDSRQTLPFRFRWRLRFNRRLTREDSSQRDTDRVAITMPRIMPILWHNPSNMGAAFLKAFSTLDSVLIESWEEGTGVVNPYTGALPPRTYGAPRPVRGRKIRCANPKCRRGGFDIFHNISEMVYEKLTTKEFIMLCSGDEGSPKGTRLGQNCLNTLHYRLTLKYKPEQSPAV